MSPKRCFIPSVGGIFPAHALGGTLSPITPRKRSGRSVAAFQATGAPQSCPATTAVSSPSASTSPTTSPTRCSCVYAPMASGASVWP